MFVKAQFDIGIAGRRAPIVGWQLAMETPRTTQNASLAPSSRLLACASASKLPLDNRPLALTCDRWAKGTWRRSAAEIECVSRRQGVPRQRSDAGDVLRLEGVPPLPAQAVAVVPQFHSLSTFTVSPVSADSTAAIAVAKLGQLSSMSQVCGLPSRIAAASDRISGASGPLVLVTPPLT